MCVLDHIPEVVVVDWWPDKKQDSVPNSHANKLILILIATTTTRGQMDSFRVKGTELLVGK